MKNAKNHGKPWGERELQRLEKLGKTHTASEIAYILGRTVWAIQTQARQRGIRYVRKPQTIQGGAAMLALLSCHQPEKCLPTGWAEEKRGYPLGSSAGLGSGGNDCRRRQDLVGEKVPAVPGGMRKKWKK